MIRRMVRINEVMGGTVSNHLEHTNKYCEIIRMTAIGKSK